MIVRGQTGNVEMRTTLADLGVTPRSAASTGGSAGQVVSPETVYGIPAYNRALQIATGEVAKLELGVYRGDGVEREKVTGSWQARTLRYPTPLQSLWEWKETIEASILARGNAYLWKNTDPKTGRVVELVALHPDQVGVFRSQREKWFQVAVGVGYVDPTGQGAGFYTVDESTILHIKGFGGGGLWVAPSPVQLYRASLGAALAEIAYEANLYERGASVRLAITYPAEMSQEQVDQWRETWKETYEGGNGNLTAVLGGGATLTPIGLSQADADFVNSRNMTVAECARMVGLPASLLDVGGAKSNSAPLSPEHERIRLNEYTVHGALQRIADALQHDPAMFGPSSATKPGWDVSEAAWAAVDYTTKAQIVLSMVQGGIWTPDDGRRRLGDAPLPGGIGAIVQITPVGGAPNDPAVPVSEPDPAAAA